MERLTNKREADAQRKEYERRLANGYPRNIPEERFLRLAAYEDIGLMPEEIKAPFTDDIMINLAAQALRMKPDRLRELAEADKDGRLAVWPCKVGDVVFARLDNKSKYVCECKVKQIVVGNIGFVTFAPIGAPEREYDVSLRGFGKTVFLSREEAEKALQEMEGKKDG